MGSAQWTPEQTAAIYTKNCDLLVAAAAGSGKTAVLVERIIKTVTDPLNPIDIDKLLVVTFTKAAAAEMRERIYKAIAAELINNPDSQHLNRQLVLLNRASITTLHSFCLDVLRRYFYRIDLDPVFRVAEDTEAAMLRMETLEDLFEDCYAKGHPDFLNLVDAYGGEKDDSVLQEMVLQLHNYAVSNPFPEHWLKKLVSDYSLEGKRSVDELAWGLEARNWLQLILAGCKSEILTAIELTKCVGGPEVYRDSLLQDLALLEDLARAVSSSWEHTYTVFAELEFDKLKACRNKDVDDKTRERVQDLREEVKKTIKGIKNELFSRTPLELLEDLKRVAPYAETLVWLVSAFSARYHQAKAEKALVDFSDLEQLCLEVLVHQESNTDQIKPSPSAVELRESFAEVFVDEYQDVNKVQEAILQLVSGEKDLNPNSFMVGDIKQSIYGFRLASPKSFRQKYGSFSATEGSIQQKIDLKKNFRSRIQVLDAVNFIFRQIMASGIGEYCYDENAELIYGASFPRAVDGVFPVSGPVEIHLLEKGQMSEENELDNEHDADMGEAFEAPMADQLVELDDIQREARLTGRLILKLVNGNGSSPAESGWVHDARTGGYRPVQYRDIVVLSRSVAGIANTFTEEFRRLGIPAYADLGTGYFAATEVETIMSLLKVIDNPRQDISLAGLLRSPIVGLNSEEMAGIRLRNQSGDYYDAVLKSAELGENAVDLKIRSFMDCLDRWRTLARQGSLAELLWLIYNETGYYAYVGGMPGGAHRQANLRALQDRARQYEASSFRGLFRFLRFIEKFQENGNDLGTARALGESEDVVRVLSIHKSKGLEFPVVFIAGLGRQFNTSDLKKKSLLHMELGLGLPVVDIKNCLSYQNLAQFAIKKRLQLELLSEEMRILYVAMTRAKEKLVLVGSVKNLRRSSENWCAHISEDKWSLPDDHLVKARTYLDWLGPTIARHRDGIFLRRLAETDLEPDVTISSDSSGWCGHFYTNEDYNDLPQVQSEDQVKRIELVRQLQPISIDAQAMDWIDDNLKWKYPWESVVGKAAKVSVTEVKRRFTDRAEQGEDFLNKHSSYVQRPAFLQKRSGLTVQEYGSAMHLVMQHLDYSQKLSQDNLGAQVQAMADQELLTAEQAASIDVFAISKFCNSRIGLRIKNARAVQRELPFTMTIPARTLYEELPSDIVDQVLIQGVIDCLIDEGDGYVLIDYKTDKIASEASEKAANRYRGQMKLYAMAVKKLMGIEVKEKYVYFFSIDSAVSCD